MLAADPVLNASSGDPLRFTSGLARFVSQPRRVEDERNPLISQQICVLAGWRDVIGDLGEHGSSLRLTVRAPSPGKSGSYSPPRRLIRRSGRETDSLGTTVPTRLDDGETGVSRDSEPRGTVQGRGDERCFPRKAAGRKYAFPRDSHTAKKGRSRLVAGKRRISRRLNLYGLGLNAQAAVESVRGGRWLVCTKRQRARTNRR